MVQLPGAADSREAQTEARTKPSQSRHQPASSISAPARPLRGDGDRLRRTGRTRAPRRRRRLREAAAAGPTGPGTGARMLVRLRASYPPRPLGGRGLLAREAPARDPGYRGRGRGSSAEPGARTRHRPAEPSASQTRQPAGNYRLGELP